MAAGDVLVTIKAKYESVQTALDSLQKIDKTIGNIGKKKLVIDASGAVRDLKQVESGLVSVGKAVSLVGEKALGVRVLRNDLNELAKQIADANYKFREYSSLGKKRENESKRDAAGVTLLAGKYKMMRVELEGMAKARSQLFQAAKGKQGDPLSDTYSVGSVKGQIEAIGKLPNSLANIRDALGQIGFLLDQATEGEEEFNLLAEAQNDLLERQLKLQDAIAKRVKEKAKAEQQSAKAASTFTKTGIPEFDRFNVKGMESTQQTLLGMSSRLAETTGVPQAEILKAFSTGGKALEGMSKRLMKLQGVTGDVSDELVKLANAATKAANTTAGGLDSRFDASGRRLSVGERFNRRFGANYGRGGPWGEGNLPNRDFRRMRRGMRRGVGSKMGQSMLLGGGFPMLFGGGAGAVGGSLLGSGIAGMMGMPSAGFGLQIAGSAIGTMLEASIKKTAELGKALSELNMDKLIESGIRVNAQTQFLIEKMKRAGDLAGAAGLADKTIRGQTGASSANFQDVNNAVGMLSAGWDRLVNSVGATLGILGAPFMVALGAILAAVGDIFGSVNKLFALVRDGIGWIAQFVPDSIKGKWDNFINSFNQGFQNAEKNIALTLETLKATVFQAEALSKIKLGAVGLRGSEGNLITRKASPMTAQGRLANLGFDESVARKKFMGFKANELFEGSEATGVQLELNKMLSTNARLFKRKPQLRKDMVEQFLGLKEKEFQDTQGTSFTLQRRQLSQQRDINVFGQRRDIDAHGRQSTKKMLQLIAGERGETQEVKRLELLEQQRQIGDSIAKLQNEYQIKGVDIKNNEEARNRLTLLQLKYEQKGLDLAYLKTDAQLRLRDLYQRIGQTIKSGIVDAIESAVEGTKTLGEVASNVFRSIAKMMLNYGISAGMKSIFPGMRASGGPVDSGKPYIVGEKGPELFVPGNSGKIVPNNQLGGGGNVSVNVAVDATGSNAEGDEPTAAQLGRLIGAAVQSELVRQKRPGGVLY